MMWCTKIDKYQVCLWCSSPTILRSASVFIELFSTMYHGSLNRKHKLRIGWAKKYWPQPYRYSNISSPQISGLQFSLITWCLQDQVVWVILGRWRSHALCPLIIHQATQTCPPLSTHSLTLKDQQRIFTSDHRSTLFICGQADYVEI